MQVGLVALEGDGDVVGSLAEAFGVQRLGNITQEVDDELESLRLLVGSNVLHLHTLGLQNMPWLANSPFTLHHGMVCGQLT